MKSGEGYSDECSDPLFREQSNILPVNVGTSISHALNTIYNKDQVKIIPKSLISELNLVGDN